LCQEEESSVAGNSTVEIYSSTFYAPLRPDIQSVQVSKTGMKMADLL
jgi:hypothetical protein